MSRRAQENLILVALLATFAGFAAVSLTYDGLSKFGPLIVASVSIAVVLGQLAVSNLHWDFRTVSAREIFARSSSHIPTAVTEKVPTAVDAAGSTGGRELKGFGLVAAFLAAILVIGLLPAVFCLLAGYLYFVGHARWYVSLLSGALGALIVFVAYHALSFPPYPGVILQSLR